MHLTSGEKQILETKCVQQHAFWVDPLRDLNGFSNAHTLMFFDTQKGGLKPRKGLEIWLPRRHFEPPNLPKGPIPTEKVAKRGGAFRVLIDEKGPGLAGHPVLFSLNLDRPASCSRGDSYNFKHDLFFLKKKKKQGKRR